MPSFNVGAGSYEYFLGFHKDQRFTENLDGYFNEKRAIPRFVAYVSCAAVFFFIMHLWHFSWDFLNAHFSEQYKANRWFFEFDIVLIMWQSVFMISLVILLSSVVHTNSQNMFHSIIVKHSGYHLFLYIVSIFLLTLFLLLPIAFLSFNDEDLGTHYLFKQTKNRDICDVLLCEYLYFRFILIYLVYPSLVPSFLFISWLIKYKCYDESNNAKTRASIQMEILLENDFGNDDNKSVSHSRSHKSVSLQFEKNSTNQTYTKTKTVKRSAKQILYPLLLLFLFSLSFTVSFIFGHIHGDPIENNFELIYWSFSIYTMTFKFMMKWIALRCDEWRSINSRNNYVFSIEWFCEFYWDLTYWMIYRYYTVFDVPSTGIFILTIFTHLSWEFLSVFVRLTPKYFKVTTYLTYNTIPLSCMDYIIDNCTYSEWRNRLSMDIAIKFGCSVCSGLFFLVNIMVNLPLYTQAATADSLSLRTIASYFSISVSTELLFYILIIVLQARIYNYSISKPVVGYINEISNKHRFFLLLLFGSVVIPVY